MSIHLFHYDVPMEDRWSERLQQEVKRPVVKNPSLELFESGGMRLTDSCWLIHESSIPADLIGRFNEKGVKWRTAPLDAAAAKVLAEAAIASIREEVKGHLSRARASLAMRQNRLSKSKKAPKEALREFRKETAALVRRLNRRMKAYQTAAQKFGAEIPSVVDGLAAVDAIKQTVTERAKAYAEVHALVERVVGKSHPMAKAAKRGDVYGPVLADWVEENVEGETGQKAAKKLRSVFGFDF